MKSQVALGLALDLPVPARSAGAGGAPGWPRGARSGPHEGPVGGTGSKTKLHLKENKETGPMSNRKVVRVGTALPMKRLLLRSKLRRGRQASYSLTREQAAREPGWEWEARGGTQKGRGVPGGPLRRSHAAALFPERQQLPGWDCCPGRGDPPFTSPLPA